MVDMRGLVGVGDVFAVPRGENITFPKSGDGQVSGVAIGIGRHDFVLDVVLHEFIDFGGRLKQAKLVNLSEASASLRLRRLFEFTNDPKRGYEFILPFRDVPPLPRPFTPCFHLRAGTCLEVETRDAGLDVDELVHGPI